MNPDEAVPNEAVANMAARLSAIDWARHGDKAWSKAALLKEYLRRAAQWAVAYGCDTRIPFFDIARCVDPSVTVDPVVVQGAVETVQAGGWDVANVTPFILRWSALRAAPGVNLPEGLEDPFEPLILLFERGGAFHTENGEVNLEWKSVRLARWRNRADDAPMPSFAPHDLNEIDRAGSLAQFGYVIGPDGLPAVQEPQ